MARIKKYESYSGKTAKNASATAAPQPKNALNPKNARLAELLESLRYVDKSSGPEKYIFGCSTSTRNSDGNRTSVCVSVGR